MLVSPLPSASAQRQHSDVRHALPCPFCRENNPTTEYRAGYYREFHQVPGEDKPIWGGDFDINEFEAAALLQMVSPKRYVDQNNATCSADRPTMNVVHSGWFGGLERDIAMTYNLRNLQVDSKVGKVMVGFVGMVILWWLIALSRHQTGLHPIVHHTVLK